NLEDAAREAQRRERQAAEGAREEVAQRRERARAADAPGYASELWGSAEAKLAQGQEAFDRKTFGAAAGIYTEARALYDRAEAALGRPVLRGMRASCGPRRKRS